MSVNESDLPRSRRFKVEGEPTAQSVATTQQSTTVPAGARKFNVEVGFPQSRVTTGKSTDVEFVFGAPGTPGAPGPPGPPGESAEALGFVFHQGTPNDTWVIHHNLAYYPSIMVIDSTGAEVEGDIVFTNPTTVTVTFSNAFAGTAYLS